MQLTLGSLKHRLVVHSCSFIDHLVDLVVQIDLVFLSISCFAANFFAWRHWKFFIDFLKFSLYVFYSEMWRGRTLYHFTLFLLVFFFLLKEVKALEFWWWRAVNILNLRLSFRNQIVAKIAILCHSLLKLGTCNCPIVSCIIFLLSVEDCILILLQHVAFYWIVNLHLKLKSFFAFFFCSWIYIST